ncbi:MAG: protoporphyrinogen oxidase [Planctomycetota bacterium]|jgi:oxygen-dependent protoporphyrinogen oxidase
MFVSLARGMSTLIDTLGSRLPAGAVRKNASVSRVERDGDVWRVVLADGSSESADGVILACPAYSSAQMVCDLDGWLADEMRVIPYASSATMSLAFRRDQIAHSLDGFGFVVPAAEKRSLIAVTYNSVKFADRAPEGMVLMRAFLGGALHGHVYEMEDGELGEAVLRDLGELIGVRSDPRFVELYRWPMSMPQYPVGHMNRVKAIEARLANWSGLAVAGNAYGGVGIPDCINSGQQAAEKIVARLEAHS